MAIAICCNVLLLAGTDSDATDAAAEFLTSEDGIRSLKQRSTSVLLA
jgi:hypothetical protein